MIIPGTALGIRDSSNLIILWSLEAEFSGVLEITVLHEINGSFPFLISTSEEEMALLPLTTWRRYRVSQPFGSQPLHEGSVAQSRRDHGCISMYPCHTSNSDCQSVHIVWFAVCQDRRAGSNEWHFPRAYPRHSATPSHCSAPLKLPPRILCKVVFNSEQCRSFACLKP